MNAWARVKSRIQITSFPMLGFKNTHKIHLRVFLPAIADISVPGVHCPFAHLKAGKLFFFFFFKGIKWEHNYFPCRRYEHIFPERSSPAISFSFTISEKSHLLQFRVAYSKTVIPFNLTTVTISCLNHRTA